MTLLEIRLFPFAALTDIRVSFDKGLTIVRGDNEAGKSTVFRALDSVLFVRTDLTPAKMKDFVRPFLPVGGGDTIAVELRFSHEGGIYRLRRQWGASTAAHLTMPDGNIITGETAITERLEPMLIAAAGTYRSILMTYQSGLSQTLAALRKEAGETLQALGDILTAAVQETDGVSVDAFKSSLKSEYDEYFSHWDTAGGRPEGGRGIQNPWRKQVGHILQTWYDKETKRQAWESAVALEQKVDALNSRLADVTVAHKESEKYIRDHAAAAKSMEERQTIEAKEALLEEQLAKLRQANSEWPVLDQTIVDLGRKLDDGTKRNEQLREETEAAQRAESRKSLVEQLNRVKVRQSQLAEARKTLEATPTLDDETLKKIAGLATRTRELQAQLSGGRLTARLTAREPLAVTMQRGADAPDSAQVLPGQPLAISADGTFKLEHAQWTLEVESGTGDFAGIAKALETSRQSLTGLLRMHGAANEDDARLNHVAYENARRGVVTAEKNLAEELAGKTYDELVANVPETGQATTMRPLHELTSELTRNTAELESLRKDMTTKSAQVEELKRTYFDKDQLFEQVGGVMAQRKAFEQKRGALPPLPAGVTDPAAFAAEYQGKVADLDRLRHEKGQLEINRASVHLPEDSTTELGGQYREAEEAFCSTQRRAMIVARIQQAVTEVEAASSGTDPYAGLKADVERYIARMTNSRYERIEVANNLPAGFVRKDGKVIGADLLSTGTKDILGLALRLAMARHFLGDNGGFLVMDDPLVDMDPRRQAAAAALLAECGGERQVIVFTCHPTHAATLGGLAVEL